MINFRLCSTPEERADVFALRHRVYVDERKWLKPQPNGLDVDPWDCFSEHMIAQDMENRAIVGTARMVIDSRAGFPYETSLSLPEEAGDRRFLYEVSRLAVDPSYRSHHALIMLGLCRGIWHAANAAQKQTWCAIVDRPVARLLAAIGFKFIFEGSAVKHMGSMSVPLICTMEESQRVLFDPRVDMLLASHLEGKTAPF